MLKVVADGLSAVSRSALDEIVLEGARRILAAALEAEVAAYVDQLPTRSTSGAAGWWSAMGTRSGVG
jgi:hypothetical protein